jgi:hypothetical protein
MSRISILKRSIRAAATALVLVSRLSPANAAYQHESVSVFPDLPISTTADRADAKAAVAKRRAIVLTSRLPWLAPVGHRQPHQADVPQSDAVSIWERQQLQFDRELDHRLIICRGC